MTRYLAFTLSVLLSVTVPSVFAEQAKEFGDYSIHYSAFTTDVLTPDVAKIYNITRSKNRAFLSVDHRYAGRKTQRPSCAVGSRECFGLGDVLDSNRKLGRRAILGGSGPGRSEKHGS